MNKLSVFLLCVWIVVIIAAAFEIGVMVTTPELKQYACIPNICVEVNPQNTGAVLNMLYDAMPNSGGEITFEIK